MVDGVDPSADPTGRRRVDVAQSRRMGTACPQSRGRAHGRRGCRLKGKKVWWGGSVKWEERREMSFVFYFKTGISLSELRRIVALTIRAPGKLRWPNSPHRQVSQPSTRPTLMSTSFLPIWAPSSGRLRDGGCQRERGTMRCLRERRM
jgi:hypothetical protein